MSLFKQQPPYQQSEIAEQVRIISELQSQSDNTDSRSQRERAKTAIDSAQEVLLFMQDENHNYYETNRNSKPNR